MISSKLFTDPDFLVYFLSEEAITIQFGEAINEQTFNRVSAFHHLIQKNPFKGYQTCVPAYASLTVFYSPVQVINSSLKGDNCFDKVSRYLHQLRKRAFSGAQTKHRVMEIPVCYGGIFGPDLAEIAKYNKLSETDVIEIHSNAIYKVYMIGFVPGFAYMGGMDERLSMPRKTVPAKAVPAGSVGIAGKQTGIYPLTIPGGWQILGQTPLPLFSLQRSQPSLLQAGDQVVFKSIDADEFDQLSLAHAD